MQFIFKPLLILFAMAGTIAPANGQTQEIRKIFNTLSLQTDEGAYRYEVQEALPVLLHALHLQQWPDSANSLHHSFKFTHSHLAPLQLVALYKQFNQQFVMHYLVRMPHMQEALCYAFEALLQPKTTRNQPADTTFTWQVNPLANQQLSALRLIGNSSGETYLFLPDALTALLMEKIQERMADSLKQPYLDALDVQLHTLWNQENALNQNWETLQRMTTLNSADQKVRLCTYLIPLEGFRQLPQGALLHKNGQKTEVTPLIDQTSEVKTPERARVNAKKWVGALYTELIEVQYKNQTYYTLLGYKGNDGLVKTRLIDVLTFVNEKPWFGAPLFRHERQTLFRPLFHYSAEANMMLRYDEKLKMIVMDNLSPSNPVFMGQPRFYGPDFSYNSYTFEKGLWLFQQDVDLRNPKVKGNTTPAQRVRNF